MEKKAIANITIENDSPVGSVPFNVFAVYILFYQDYDVRMKRKQVSWRYKIHDSVLHKSTPTVFNKIKYYLISVNKGKKKRC